MSSALGAPTDSVIKTLGVGINQNLTKRAESANPKQPTPPNYTEIERAIADMLTESTGAHFLDSGGAHGRGWQRNRKIADFRDLEACGAEIHAPQTKGIDGAKYSRDGEILVSFNVFAYLTAYLEIDDDARMLQREFDKFAALKENERVGYYPLMEQFAEEIAPQHGFKFGGTTNTYNYETILSQVLQYTWLFKNDDEYDTYIMLQIHNGCDVRGGYTAPKIFRVCDRDYFLIAQNDISVSCGCGYCNAISDDGGYDWQLNDAPYWNALNQKRIDTDEIITHDDAPLMERFNWHKNDDPKTYGRDTVTCKRCGAQITFAVMESY